jgi:citrate lyase beta subunit
MVADVVLIRWPEDREDAVRLVEAGVALLYLVDAESDPPAPTSCLEDWVRLNGDERDLRARLEALETRAAAHRMPPTVDSDGRLRYQGKLMALSAVVCA